MTNGAAPHFRGSAAADQPIAPLIPATGSRAQRQPGHPPAASTLPLASPPAFPAAPPDVVYGMGRIDASGRVADRAITQALNWQAGDRLTITASPGVVVARRDPEGMTTLATRQYIAIPAALCHRCGLHPGDGVLLAAAPAAGALAAYSLATVDQALRARHPFSGERG